MKKDKRLEESEAKDILNKVWDKQDRSLLWLYDSKLTLINPSYDTHLDNSFITDSSRYLIRDSHQVWGATSLVNRYYFYDEYYFIGHEYYVMDYCNPTPIDEHIDTSEWVRLINTTQNLLKLYELKIWDMGG